MKASRPNPSAPAVVDSFPVDESVYGVRGLAGNMMDWCADSCTREGPQIAGARVVLAQGESESDVDPAAYWSLRGGSWGSIDRYTRLAYRNHGSPNFRSPDLGFRLCRSRVTPR